MTHDDHAPTRPLTRSERISAGPCAEEISGMTGAVVYVLSRRTPDGGAVVCGVYTDRGFAQRLVEQMLRNEQTHGWIAPPDQDDAESPWILEVRQSTFVISQRQINR